jgi:transposase
MARSVTMDLRRRVVEAIGQGLSRRQAAKQFGVSPASAVRWQAQLQASGDVTPKPQGGDRKSARIEAEADLILDEVAKAPDVTLMELKAKLQERGASFSVGTLWRFFDRRGVTFKKNSARRRATAGRRKGKPRDLV